MGGNDINFKVLGFIGKMTILLLPLIENFVGN